MSTGRQLWLGLSAFGYTSFPLAIENAGLSDLRIVADEIQDGAPGYHSTPYSVCKDSGIDKIEDMKGKVAVTNGRGSRILRQTAIMRRLLKRFDALEGFPQTAPSLRAQPGAP